MPNNPYYDGFHFDPYHGIKNREPQISVRIDEAKKCHEKFKPTLDALRKRNGELLKAIETTIDILSGLDNLHVGERTPDIEMRWQLLKYLDKVYKDK